MTFRGAAGSSAARGDASSREGYPRGVPRTLPSPAGAWVASACLAALGACAAEPARVARVAPGSDAAQRAPLAPESAPTPPLAPTASASAASAAPPASASAASAAPPAAPPACRSAAELFAATAHAPPRRLAPGLDLDGDGAVDPVFVAGEGGPRATVALYVERGGCGRYLGAVHANDLATVRIRGRDKAGWAIVHGSMPFTFDELEEKAVYDGTRYVTYSRRRDYPPAAAGQKRVIAAWSAWSLDEPGD